MPPDVVGRRFVLLAGAKGAAWVAAAERAAQRLDVPLAAYRFGIDLEAAGGAAAHGIGPDGALLVRPDGFVAWRAAALVEQPERVLDEVLARLLSRERARHQASSRGTSGTSAAPGSAPHPAPGRSPAWAP
jgi:putative polyketide hydroxylase